MELVAPSLGTPASSLFFKPSSFCRFTKTPVLISSVALTSPTVAAGLISTATLTLLWLISRVIVDIAKLTVRNWCVQPFAVSCSFTTYNLSKMRMKSS